MTDDDFILGIACSVLAADDGSCACWSWRDWLVFSAIVTVTVAIVGGVTWLCCR